MESTAGSSPEDGPGQHRAADARAFSAHAADVRHEFRRRLVPVVGRLRHSPRDDLVHPRGKIGSGVETGGHCACTCAHNTATSLSRW